MRVLSYNSDSKRLKVIFNTSDIWEFFPVFREDYLKSIELKDPSKILKSIIRKPDVTGIKVVDK